MIEAKEYMSLMELADKADSLVASLSGGMKRKLCLSIALMGKAEVCNIKRLGPLESYVYILFHC